MKFSRNLMAIAALVAVSAFSTVTPVSAASTPEALSNSFVQEWADVFKQDLFGSRKMNSKSVVTLRDYLLEEFPNLKPGYARSRVANSILSSIRMYLPEESSDDVKFRDVAVFVNNISQE